VAITPKVRSLIKRLLDIAISFSILVALLVPFSVVSLLIKVSDPGPVFYLGLRVGKNGKPFRMFKFRTMVVNASATGGPNTPSDDPRITNIGYYLRRVNIDELPQFINVLKGDMSIVGPRPEVPEYVKLFNKKESRILRVRPGITDLATLWIRDEGSILEGSPDPEKTYLEEIWPEKHRLALEYIDNQSMLLDIKIMFLTFKSHLIDRVIQRLRSKRNS